MELSRRIKGLTGLGKFLNHIHEDDLEELLYSISGRNSWFDKENVNKALEGLKQLLDEKNMLDFIQNYPLEQALGKK